MAEPNRVCAWCGASYPHRDPRWITVSDGRGARAVCSDDCLAELAEQEGLVVDRQVPPSMTEDA